MIKLFNYQGISNNTNFKSVRSIQTICTRKQLQPPNDQWIDTPNIPNKLNLKVNLNQIKYQN